VARQGSGEGRGELTALDSAAFSPAVGGVVSWTLALPASVGLMGLHLYQQALVLDTAAAGSATVSNAIDMLVGMR